MIISPNQIYAFPPSNSLFAHAQAMKYHANPKFERTWLYECIVYCSLSSDMQWIFLSFSSKYKAATADINDCFLCIKMAESIPFPCSCRLPLVTFNQYYIQT